MNRISYYLLIILITFSCNRNEICSNQKRLIQSNKKLNTFNFDTLLENTNLLDYELESNLEEVASGIERTEYSLTINKLKVKAYFVKVKRQTYLHRKSSIEFSISENGKIFCDVNQEIINKDEIKNWFLTNFPSKDDYYVNIIRIGWNGDINKENLKSIILEMINGYLSSCERLSISKFSKNTCELNEEQLNEIKKAHPFDLELMNFSKEFESPPVRKIIDIEK